MNEPGPAPRCPPQPARLADAASGLRHVFIRDLVLEASVGVHRLEQVRRQRVRINLDLAVAEGAGPLGDELANVVCYERLAEGVRALVAGGHVRLVETLAERIAQLCLNDARVRVARVRVEKPDVLPDAASVGVEIERRTDEA
ncbi:MAG: dihydroneopterin aldolase [Proteobacteria bacterium]|nr:dihydroneopterin aldolase [Pseudomonadota bacterium]